MTLFNFIAYGLWLYVFVHTILSFVSTMVRVMERERNKKQMKISTLLLYCIEFLWCFKKKTEFNGQNESVTNLLLVGRLLLNQGCKYFFFVTNKVWILIKLELLMCIIYMVFCFWSRFQFWIFYWIELYFIEHQTFGNECTTQHIPNVDH